MFATNTDRWIGAGLLSLPLYGALTFWSSLNPQPDPNIHYEAWSRFVITDHYALTHVFGSILGLILAIFGTFALGACLTCSRAGHMGLWAMVVTVFGSALFLPGMGVARGDRRRTTQAGRIAGAVTNPSKYGASPRMVAFQAFVAAGGGR